MAFPYVPYDWSVGDVITEARMDNLETQFQSVLDLLTTRGDISFRGAATWERLAKGTDGQFLAMGADDPGWITAPYFPMKQVPAVTRWVLPGWYAKLGFNRLLSAGRIYYIPIFVPQTTTYIRIGGEVRVGVAGSADLRIFEWENGLPGDLVLSAGTVDTAVAAYKEIIISEELTRGYYYLAIRCSSGSTWLGMDETNASVPPVGGIREFARTDVFNVILTVTAAYADPAPAPTGFNTAADAVILLREN